MATPTLFSQCYATTSLPSLDRFVSRRSGAWNYEIDTSLLNNYGWESPIDNSPLRTTRQYDYLSPAYFDYWHEKTGRSDVHHAGVDFPHLVGYSVTSISEGIVKYILRDNAKTNNNSRIHVHHTDALGEHFIAIYGHTYASPGIEPGRRVIPGEKIGTIKSFGSPDHLHFELNRELQKTTYGYVHRGEPISNFIPPIQHLVEHPANLSPTVLGNLKELSRGFENRKAHEGAVAIRNLIDQGIIIDNQTFDSSESGDNIWHGIDAPISRGEFHKMTSAAAKIVNNTVTFTPLTNHNGYLKLGELLLLCNQRFDLGVNIATSLPDRMKALVESFAKTTTTFRRRENGRVRGFSQSINDWKNPRSSSVEQKGIVDLVSKEKTYIPKSVYENPDMNRGYDLHVSRSIAAIVISQILFFRAYNPTAKIV